MKGVFKFLFLGVGMLYANTIAKVLTQESSTAGEAEEQQGSSDGLDDTPIDMR